MPNKYGVRCLYHQARRRFREPRDFEVRYWTLADLAAKFEEKLGPAEISVDCFFGLGLQASDAPMLPSSKRALSTARRRCGASVTTCRCYRMPRTACTCARPLARAHLALLKSWRAWRVFRTSGPAGPMRRGPTRLACICGGCDEPTSFSFAAQAAFGACQVWLCLQALVTHRSRPTAHRPRWAELGADSLSACASRACLSREKRAPAAERLFRDTRDLSPAGPRGLGGIGKRASR